MVYICLGYVSRSMTQKPVSPPPDVFGAALWLRGPVVPREVEPSRKPNVPDAPELAVQVASTL